VSLRHAALSAGRWTTVSALLRLALQFAQTMILARLLTPADYGLMAVVAAPIAMLAVFADAGISRALIHFPLPDRERLASLFWANLGVSLLLALAFALVGVALGASAEQPGLRGVILLASAYFPLTALGQQFKVLAEKDLQFSELARIEVAAAAFGFVAAIGLALAGAGVHALVAGLLGTAAANSALAYLRLSQGRRPFLHFRWADIAPMLRFGGYQTGERLAATVQLQSDVLIGGALFGTAAIGIYSVPRDLCLRVASTVVNPVITRIGFPVMAKLQHDVAALKNVYLQSLRMTTALNFPLYAALALFAEAATLLLFGDAWRDAAPYLRLFAIWGLIRSVGSPVGSLLHAAGLVRRSAIWNLVLLLLVPLVLWLGAKAGGPTGLAWTMVLAQALIFLPSWRYLVQPACGASLREFLAACAPAALATLLACVAAWLVSQHAPLGPGGDAIAGLAAGAVAYLLGSYAFNRRWLLTVAELVKWPRRESAT